MDKNARVEVVVFSGLSGSGKSTLGGMLQDYLKERGRRVALLDGDSLREIFDGSLGYSAEDRLMVSKILVYTAKALATNETDVILATMFSQPGARDFLKKHAQYVEVFCDAELDTLMTKDSKSLYRDAMVLDRPNIVGHDLEFERPQTANLVINTHRESPEESFKKVVQFLESQEVFGLSRSQSV